MKRWLLVIWLGAGAVQAAELPAVLQWSQRVELSTPVSGVVQDVNVAAGERVRKGQVLLQLDDRVYAGRVEEASAAVARQQEEVAEAGRDLKRVQELYDRTVISTSELDLAKMRQAKAVAQLRETQARHKQEAKNRVDSVLRAPFDALIVTRMVEPGQTVAAGLQPQALLVLARSGEMVARAQASAEQIAALKTGQDVTVAVGKQNFRGKIRTLGLEPGSRDKSGNPLYALDVVFPTGDTVLRSGASASITLP